MGSVHQQPSLLLAFLRAMPKGGDLHNHLFGAIYAESFIDYAAADGLCVDRTTSQMIPGRCEPCEKYTNKPAVKCAYTDHVLYNSMVDAYSMRNWTHGEESGHDHFFASFDKFGPSTAGRIGDMLAEAASRAAADHLQYLELMHTADGMNAAALGAKNGWNPDFATLRKQLLDGGLIRLDIARRNDQLTIVVENPCEPDAATERPGGLGLANVRGRLEAMFGREATLHTQVEAGQFRVEVHLPCV